MSITDPEQLVNEFKKSGEFDRLRRELLTQFKDDESITTFTSRVRDIILQRLAEDERLLYLPAESVHNELMQDMDRFPLVQRAVTDLPALKDPSFSASIRHSLANLLRDGPSTVDRKPEGVKKDANEDADMDDSDASDSDSSESSHEGHEEHEEGGNPDLVDDMPQNSRIRHHDSPSATELKLHALVNGVELSEMGDRSSFASSEPEATPAPSQERNS